MTAVGSGKRSGGADKGATVGLDGWQARGQLTAIVEHSEEAIISTDLEGKILEWNTAAERIFGYAAGEMLGKSILEIIPPRLQEEERARVERLRQGKGTAALETARVGRDGREIPVSMSLTPVFDLEGHVAGAVRIARDTTAQKAAEARLAEARRKLEQKATDLEERVQERTVSLQQTVSELEAFSYSLSHDMRAPLRAIQSYSQIVLEDCGEAISPTCVAYLHKVVASAERLDRLILDLLAFARLSQEDLAVKAVDVDKLVREIVAERPDFQLPNADIRVEAPLAKALGNEASLTQCITNLLDNAIKYVSRGVRPVVRIWSEAREAGVRLWFEDNGIGIDSAGQRRLFQMFQRVHGNDYEGTGIGLAIVRKAVERMHGSAGVESEPGKGSRFWLQLPGASA